MRGRIKEPHICRYFGGVAAKVNRRNASANKTKFGHSRLFFFFNKIKYMERQIGVRIKFHRMN